jgi:hypothetical protein
MPDRPQPLEQQAGRLGDRRWRELLNVHDEVARRVVEEFGGQLIKTTGDGILATFDGPGRAIPCAAALRDELAGIGASSSRTWSPRSTTVAASTTWKAARSPARSRRQLGHGIDSSPESGYKRATSLGNTPNYWRVRLKRPRLGARRS